MRHFWQATRARFATGFELVVAFWEGPYWWLVPVVIILLMTSVFLIALQAAPLVAPFVYSIF